MSSSRWFRPATVARTSVERIAAGCLPEDMANGTRGRAIRHSSEMGMRIGFVVTE